jgi:hypothetical protein
MVSLTELSRKDKELLISIYAEKARRHADDFCEFVLKDDKGKPVRQSAIHREINWHIDECRKQKLNCGILAPWRHGKTEQVVIGRTLQFLGENLNNRVFIVCNADDNAAARVESISKYIENDINYHLVYPDVVPGDKTEWGRHKLMVKRSSMSKDGSVEAWGITTSGTGSGCDFLIVDDPVDLRNAVLNPALRPQVKEAFKNVWSSRLAPNGFKIYIATVWHNDDLTNEMLKNPEWCFLVIKVSEDFTHFDCESPLKGKFMIPLWEEAWPKDKLIQKHREIGSRAFNRGYRQIALSDEDRTLGHYLNIYKYGARWQDIVRPEWPRVAGMDPFGQFVVIFTLAIAPDGKRYPIEIRRGKWNPTQSIQQLIDAFSMHHHQLIVVENNAAQEAIVQWALEKGHQIPIWPFTTGKQKADPLMGLPGLDVEFENGSWVVAVDREHEPDCQCGFCVWKREMQAHPVGETADCVMASWFAREAARALTFGIVDEPINQQAEIITQEDVGLEQVKIGDY